MITFLIVILFTGTLQEPDVKEGIMRDSFYVSNDKFTWDDLDKVHIHDYRMRRNLQTFHNKLEDHLRHRRFTRDSQDYDDEFYNLIRVYFNNEVVQNKQHKEPPLHIKINQMGNGNIDSVEQIHLGNPKEVFKRSAIRFKSNSMISLSQISNLNVFLLSIPIIKSIFLLF